MRKGNIKDKGRYLGECRRRFNVLEQWDGKRWREPAEVGDYGGSIAPKIHFDVEDALHTDDDPVDRAFRPRS